MQGIHVYGTDWCKETRHTLDHLQDLGVPYDYVDIDENADAREWVKRQNDGRQKTPTVDVKGFVLSVPSDAELDVALRKQHAIGN